MSRYWLVVVIVASYLVVSAGLFFVPRRIPTTSVTITSSAELISALRHEQLLRHPVVAWLAIHSPQFNRRTVLPGIYSLTGRLSDKDILAWISNPTHREVVVVIPEGFRLEQIALRLERLGVAQSDDFLTASRMRPSYRPLLSSKIAPIDGASLEGFLFPDSYRFHQGVSGESVVKRMLGRFSEVTRDLPLTYDSLKLASLVEREAKSDDERGDIAGVFANRLTIGQALESDATVAYSRDNQQIRRTNKSDWQFWKPIRSSDLAITDRWNTYRVTGLPITPICSPGRKSLEAAIGPHRHQYYYFFSDSQGQLQLSQTFAQHREKINKLLSP